MSQELADELENVIEGAVDDLRRLTPAEASGRSSPEKWSKQEVLGHLIDAAANNHHRFVRAQHTTELRFPPYDQNAWVACQRYDQCDWNRLVDLWIAYHRHLVHIIANIPAEKMAIPCWVDWYDTPKAIPLRSMIEEYIVHIRHHLEQILG
jgi:DinB superfamily